MATNGFQLVWTCVSESLHSLKSQQDKKGESCQSSDNETILGEIDSTIRYFTIHNKCLHWLCSTCSVTCTYWLSGIVGQDNIWLGSLMTWEPLFAQSILHDQEPIILSCQAQPTWSLYNEQFFFFNWTLLFLFISLLLSAGIFQGCSAFCRLRADPYVQSLLHN